MKKRIICIGNRFVAGDSAGPLVFDRLQKMLPLPEVVELIEGGIAGLNLLPLLEEGGRVVFVDAVKGFDPAGGLVILDHKEILSIESQLHFDHAAGLPYVLAVLPRVCEGELPEEIVLLGIEGEYSGEMIERAARMSITVATHGVKGLT